MQTRYPRWLIFTLMVGLLLSSSSKLVGTQVQFRVPAVTSGTLPATPNAQRAVKISSGNFQTCALMNDGSIQCWGQNDHGELGIGSIGNHSVPVSVQGLPEPATAIAAGGHHTCALLSAGGIDCWGNNGTGQLGDGSNDLRMLPTPVSGLVSGVTAIAAGEYHTCGLVNGGVQCWGHNGYGQLGDSSTTDRAGPVPVSGLAQGVVAIAAADSHTCALMSDGGVKCWGDNTYGELGDGTTISHTTPVDVQVIEPIAAIAAGFGHTCALTRGGRVKCWGWNAFGQLGDGTTDDHPLPIQVNGLARDVLAITAGKLHTCALNSSGGVVCWGDNGYGRLGDGTPIAFRPTPGPVSGLASGIIALEAGWGHTCVVTGGGGVACWGYNVSGQIGDNTTIDSHVPVDVVGLHGEATFTISGRVTNDADQPIPGVMVSAGLGFGGLTDTNGIYTITNVITGTYTLTPTLSGYIFAPITGTVSVPPDKTIQNFIARPIPAPFLDLPFEYDGTSSTFVTALQNWKGGRVNSWFDHKYPDYGEDNGTGLWLYNSKHDNEQTKRWVGGSFAAALPGGHAGTERQLLHGLVAHVQQRAGKPSI